MKSSLKIRFSKPILKRHILWDSVDVTALKWENYCLTDWQLGRVKGGATMMQDHEGDVCGDGTVLSPDYGGGCKELHV